jgi:RNA polymerase sigma-70 factor (ECF subfamily)
MHNDLMRIFERLKPREQALLWLAYVEGFDHGEIALALQLRENSIRVLLFRARKKFASLLTREGIVDVGS